MFKKSHPLQSKSEIILRNIVVIAMIAFFSIFLIVPIGIAFAGSFHEWNPLSGTYNFLGLEDVYKRQPEDRFITVEFGEWKDGKVKQKATLAKMARGEMVRFMAENNIQDPEEIKAFHELGFSFEGMLSDEKKFVFIL